MNWNDVKDKSGTCNISADLSIVKEFYTPESAQKIIDERGARAFCEEANKKIGDKSIGRKLSYILGKPDMLIDIHYSINLVGG